MIVTFTGPSGSGKTSLLFKLMKRWPDKIHPIISSTSRSPRSREIEGISYYFVDRSAFDSEDMVEKVIFGDNMYGLTREELSKACASPKICIAIVDAKGSLWLKEQGCEAVPCASVKEAVDRAMDHAGKDGVVCAFGSLYYIGQIRGLFRY